jgi:plasmid segregation protein ParM
MIIGVDNGNAQTKTANTVFPSGTVAHDAYPEFANEVIHFNGKYYTISSKRSDVKKDKTASIECFILTLFGIAKELEFRGVKNTIGVDVELGVGLPWQNALNKKNLDKFKNYFYSFGNNIKFEYNKKPYEINLNEVVVGAQGLAVTLNMTGIFQEYSRIFIVDIGGWTVDCILVTKKGASTEYSISKPYGVIKFMNAVKSRVLETYGQVVEDVHIMDVLYDRPNVLSEDIKNVIKEEAARYPLILVNSFLEDNIDLSTNPVVLMGGGAQLLKKFISEDKNITKPFFVDDISANAKGYEKMVEVVLAKKASK